MEKNTARNFVLQLGSLIALYASLTALITLVFGIINILFPDNLNYYNYQTATEQIRFSIAMLIVFFPTYITITRMVNTMRRATGDGAYLGLTKWLIYLSLLVAGLILLGDLVALILAFLNGELTTRFVLKALALFIIVGDAFVYYALDAKNYWQDHESKSKLYGVVVTVIVVSAVIFGFTRIELPAEQRAIIFDQERIADLQTIQSQLGEFYRAKQTLPESLDELESIGFGIEFDVDPETDAPYTYTRISDTSFELCAVFGQESTKDTLSQVRPLRGGFEENWEHPAGSHCFTRTIDPDFFKPFL